jgi:hypothetical protein
MTGSAQRYAQNTTGTTQDGVLHALIDLIAILRADLPSGDFTPEQAAMARLPLPFRNMVHDPFIPEIGQTARTTPYSSSLIAAIEGKCSSFRIINPNQCYVRFRGASGPNDLIKEGEGRLIGPGAVEVFSTQNPTHLSVLPVARPGLPIPAELASLELNYGIGS